MAASPRGSTSRIALFQDHLRGLIGKGGGIDRNQWRLGNELARRGHTVDFLITEPLPQFAIENLPERISIRLLPSSNSIRTRIFVFSAARSFRHAALMPVLLARKPSRLLRHAPGLRHYLDRYQPERLISAGTYENLAATLAWRSSERHTTLILSERNPISNTLHQRKHARRWRWRHIRPLIDHLYNEADHIVSVSRHVQNDLTETLELSAVPTSVIYNPAYPENLDAKIATGADHRWLQDRTIPLLVAIGRLQPQKAFDCLIEAVAKLQTQRPVRLLIIGDGPSRSTLESMITDRNLAGCVELAGYQPNPFPFLANANLFVLSSRYEGFGNVLVEALACGCPVVSTDCPGGPREILVDGKFGRLVAPGDTDALAKGIAQALDNPVNEVELRHRALKFSVERAAEDYLALPARSRQADSCN